MYCIVSHFLDRQKLINLKLSYVMDPQIKNYVLIHHIQKHAA